MALLVTRVLGDKVEVLAADDEGAVHLGADDGAGQDTAADGDLAGEGALLVCLRRRRLASLFCDCLVRVRRLEQCVQSSHLVSPAPRPHALIATLRNSDCMKWQEAVPM